MSLIFYVFTETEKDFIGLPGLTLSFKYDQINTSGQGENGRSGIE